jgi:alpha-tubulin suppressor-like RCC1 family protein
MLVFLLLVLPLLFFSGQVYTWNDGTEISLFVSFIEDSEIVQAASVNEAVAYRNTASIAKRVARVGINEAVRTPGSISNGDVIKIGLFENMILQAVVDKVDFSNEVLTTRARVSGHEAGFVIICAHEGQVLTLIELPEAKRQYQVIYDGSEESYLLYEIFLDEVDWPESAPPLIPDEIILDDITLQTQAAGDPMEQVEIDVMVVYSTFARSFADSHYGSILLPVSQAMARAQLVLDNSDVFITLRLVFHGEVEYTEDDMGRNPEQDLRNLTDGKEGLAIVHDWRNEHGADLVALLLSLRYEYQSNVPAGVAWQLDDPGGRPSRGFSVTDVYYGAISYTFIHELGHNLGADHHKEQNYQPGPGLYDYSAGWRWGFPTVGYYCSVMAYEDGKYFEDGRTHSRVPYFSNPGVFYPSLFPTGHAEHGDNARTLRETKHVVANYRPSVPTNNCLVHVPDRVTGPETGLVQMPYTYRTGGSRCHLAHDVEYRFWWWKDGFAQQMTEWSSKDSAAIVFPEPGIYYIRAQARCVITGTISVSQSRFATTEIFLPCDVPVPNEPLGVSDGLTASSYYYSTSVPEASSCGCGSELEFRFSWGDGTFSQWGPDLYAFNSWISSGTYSVSAQARCVRENNLSGWSDELSVTIAARDCWVLAPNKPSGPVTGVTNTSYTYTTGGSVCNGNHSVEYQFEWHKGGLPYNSEWDSTTSTTISFNTPGTYYVYARARCSDDTNVKSFFSEVLTVNITGAPCAVSPPNRPSGPTSGQVDTNYLYTTGGSACACGSPVEYSFLYPRDNKTWLTPWSSSTQSTISFDAEGSHQVYAQARCTYDTSVLSHLSEGLTVDVSVSLPPCEVTQPDRPSGPTRVVVGTEYTYTTGGSTCVNDHSVEYAFLVGKDDEGVGGTEMCSSGSGVVSFAEPGTYMIISAARCSEDQGTLVYNLDYLEVIVSDGSLPGVEPAGHNFGLVEAGGISAGRNFTITNHQTTDMTLGQVMLTGINPGEFVVTKDEASGITLAPGQSASFAVAFTPCFVGEKTAIIKVETDNIHGDINFLVKGTGIMPAGLVAWGGSHNWQSDVPPGSGFAAVAAGGWFSLALKADGSLVAWGENMFGETDVPLGNDFVAIAAGGGHGVALRTNGSLAAWGYNEHGQADATAGNNYIAVAAGDFHSVALRTDGSLVAWGYNHSGQANVPAGNDFVAIAAGGNHSVALRADGSLVAWGDNHYGQTNVPAGNDFVAIAAGDYHNVAIRTDGSLAAWGRNDHGQTNVPAGTGFITVSCGGSHSVAFSQNGNLVAWGAGGSGQLAVPDSYSLVAVAAASNYNVALLLRPEVSPLGSNLGPVELGTSVRKTFTVNNSGLGAIQFKGLVMTGNDSSDFVIENDGVSQAKIMPGESVTFDVVFAPASGGEKTAVIRFESSALDCNVIVIGTGIVPVGLTTWGSSPAGTPADGDLVAVAAGSYHSVGLKEDGSLTAWGLNNHGQTDVPAGNDYVAVSAGEYFSVALKADGSLTAWGRNVSGETNAPAGSGFVAVAAGGYRGVALRGDGSLAAWGVVGAAGLPQETDFVAVAAGGYHSLGLRADGSLTAWGSNTYGQADVPAGTDFVAVAGGLFHSVALRADGSLIAWGYNEHGQAGAPSGNDFTAVTAGAFHNVALKSDGSLAAWGRNDNGQANVPDGTGFLSVAAGREYSLALRIKPDISPVAYNFGPVEIGGPFVTRTFTITNNRSSELILGNFSVIGINAEDFVVKDEEAAGARLKPGGKVTFDVVFSAAVLGEKSVLISIETNRPEGDMTVLAKGTGVFPGGLVAWGKNSSGETNTPAGNDYVVVSAGGMHSVALKADGSLDAWGYNHFGQADVPAGNDYVAVAAGGNHSLALRADGILVAWGSNASGQAGVPAGTAFAAVAAGGNYSVGIRADGSLAAWGNNEHGQTNVPGGTGFVAVAAGSSHVLALKEDGSLLAWGNTGDVPEGNDFVAVAAGGLHSMALKADGSLVAWGSNTAGQTNVPGGNDYIAIGAGYYHSAALRADGSLVAWGWNADGQTNVPAGTGYTAVAAGDYHNVALRAKFNITPAGYNFGPTEMGSTASQTFTITNSTGGNLQVDSLLLAGPHALDFRIENNSVSVIAPGQSRTFDVVFAPAAAGEKTGIVKISSNHPDKDAIVLLKGTGTAAGSLEAWGWNNQNQTNVPPGSDYVAVAAGGSHNVALKADGSLAAWGSNSQGQTTVPAGTDYLAVAAGVNHSMALKEDGSLVVWGDNSYFQRTNAPAGPDFIAVAAGSYHNVAIKGNGGLVAWGWNDYGQADVPPETGFVAAAAGFDHTVAIRADGSLAAWGRNHKGQTNVPAGNDYVALAAGTYYSVALKTDGTLTAWGDNEKGQTDVPVGNGFIALDALGSHIVALRADGTLAAWGDNTFNKAIVPGGGGYVAVAAGGSHSVALHRELEPELTVSPLGVTFGPVELNDSARRTFTITNSGTGELAVSSITVTGFNSTEFSIVSDNVSTAGIAPGGSADFEVAFVPVSAGEKTAIVRIESNHSGGNVTMLLKGQGAVSGRLVAWGRNDSGQTDVPRRDSNFIAVSGGEKHTLALRTDGTLAAWGENHYGQADVPSGDDFVAVAAGGNHSVALKADGSLMAWGHNNSGQADVPLGDDFVAVAAGDSHSVALRADGSLAAWGDNSDGQTDIPAGYDFVAVAAGGYHNVALKADGTLVAWGYDYYGQTGVPSGTDYVAVAAGGYHSVALKADGSLVAWGDDEDGQLNILAGNDYVTVAAGRYHSVALKADGSLAAWGYNLNGQTDVPAGSDFVAVAAGDFHSLALTPASAADECFIATAAFGSKLDPGVALLRRFRDDRLLTNKPGQAFVSLYYSISPGIAAYIAQSNMLQWLVKTILLPVIAVAYLILYPALLLAIAVLFCAAVYFQRRRKVSV